jgi:hypothetical protein
VAEIWVVPRFTGAQLGTKDNPMVAATTTDFDALLASLPETLGLHLEGSFKRKGAYRWGPLASRNTGANWTIDGTAEVSLDPEAIPDSEIDDQPLYVFASGVGAPKIQGITVVGNHSVLAERWRSQGKSLRTGSVLFYGDASIDGATLKDFGALRAPDQPPDISSETFVAEIVGSGNITNCVFQDFDPSSSDDQVTVFRTMASENGEKTSLVRSVHEHNTTNVTGSKLVQAHTIYQSPGLVRFNKSVGADVFYYADTFNNSDITIGGVGEENEATDCIHGVQLKLSPTAGTDLEMPKHFSHERYVIGPNRFKSRGKDVSLDTCGPPTATRYIRDISVDAALSFENIEYGGVPGATNVTRSGVVLPGPARKGCLPRFLQR